MKISLITVTYNSSRTLRDTIVSVLAQTYQDIEYIIIDGLSEDNTIEIIKEYEPQFEDGKHNIVLLFIYFFSMCKITIYLNV